MAFNLNPNPQFKAPVDIPVPGEKPERVLFTFRHKSRKQFDDLVKAFVGGEKTIDDAVKEVVVEWIYPGVDFSDEALIQCFEMFPGSAQAIFTAYRAALFEGARKN